MGHSELCLQRLQRFELLLQADAIFLTFQVISDYVLV